jgi:hypothetical protein
VLPPSEPAIAPLEPLLDPLLELDGGRPASPDPLPPPLDPAGVPLDPPMLVPPDPPPDPPLDPPAFVEPLLLDPVVALAVMPVLVELPELLFAVEVQGLGEDEGELQPSARLDAATKKPAPEVTLRTNRCRMTASVFNLAGQRFALEVKRQSTPIHASAQPAS